MALDFVKVEFVEGIESLKKYAKRVVYPRIDLLKIDSPQVNHFIHSDGFCYETLKALEDFYIEDWDFVGVLLYDDDYDLAALILSRKSPIYKCHYRIAVSATAPHELIDVASSDKGFLFSKRSVNKYERKTIEQIYNLKWRYIDHTYRPTNYLPITREVDEGGQLLFEICHPNMCLHTHGPRALFEYAHIKLHENHFQFDSKTQRRLDYKWYEFAEKLTNLSTLKWHIESVFLDDNLAIDYLLLYHDDDQNIYVLLNRQYEIIDVFDDLIIYKSNITQFTSEQILDIRHKYSSLIEEERERYNLLQSNIPFEKTLPPVTNAIVSDDVLYEFRANFSDQTIIIVGPSYINEQEMNSIAYEMGLPKHIIDYRHPDYDKITGTSFDHLRNNCDHYLGIILGPTPHKLRNLGKHASLSSKLKEEPGYPYTVEATTQTIGKNLRLTRNSFKIALSKIIRHHLQQIEASQVV